MPITVQKCIVCNNPQARRQEGAGDFARFDCPRCGAFVLTGSAEAALERLLTEMPLRRSLMSHTFRSMQRSDQKHLGPITTEELPGYWKDERLPPPLEQADALILWIGDHQPKPSIPAKAEISALGAMLGLASRTDANDWVGLDWLLSQLAPKHLFQADMNMPGTEFSLMLEMPGWERYEALKKARIESRNAFMAMKFGDSELDEMVDKCFRRAVRRTGFELRRAAVLSARFVISDLTHGSYGTYWEAGFGEGRGIPVIYTSLERSRYATLC